MVPHFSVFFSVFSCRDAIFVKGQVYFAIYPPFDAALSRVFSFIVACDALFLEV